MKGFLCLLVGVVAGVALARRLERTEPGREFFSGVDRKAREFGRAVADGYRDRGAELG